MPLISTPSQGNDQGNGPGDQLTTREQMLAEALHNVLVAAGMICPDAYVSPPELLVAAEDYVSSVAA